MFLRVFARLVSAVVLGASVLVGAAGAKAACPQYTFLPQQGYVSAAELDANFSCLASLNGNVNGILQGNGSGTVSALTIGSGLTYSGGTLSATGGGAGYFASVLSAKPTMANTGYTTWLNQNGATETDSAMGITIQDTVSGGTNTFQGLIKSVPATPYSAVYLIVPSLTVGSPFSGFAVGWYDGSNKMHCLNVQWQTTSAIEGSIIRMSTPTTYVSTDIGPVVGFGYNLVWVKLKDDGTNVSWSYSFDGVAWVTFYSVAKSSGYLGASGYTKLFVGIAPQGAGAAMTVASYAETTP